MDMWGRAQEELAIEFNSAFDDHHERYVNERLDTEYEWYCQQMNEWDMEWPLEPMP